MPVCLWFGLVWFGLFWLVYVLVYGLACGLVYGLACWLGLAWFCAIAMIRTKTWGVPSIVVQIRKKLVRHGWDGQSKLVVIQTKNQGLKFILLSTISLFF